MDAVSYAHSAKQAKRIKKFIANPDSNSGIITVPKVIEAGESITVPAGRVAVLPNVQIDGEIVVEAGAEIFIPSGTTLSKVVETEGNQDIDGIKTFLESPIVPTAIEGNQAVNLETANNYDLGVGQTWQDVTASRSAGVTYTNSTGKPIEVFFNLGFNGGGDFTFTIGSQAINLYESDYDIHQSSFIIPGGETYKLQSKSYNIFRWYELR